MPGSAVVGGASAPTLFAPVAAIWPKSIGAEAPPTTASTRPASPRPSLALSHHRKATSPDRAAVCRKTINP
ncbi:DUF6053 domain-containing protein [Lysobacter enzymogenes]|uniref:DUF6053 domain-containing protein n=1 Tax=Lysobacter enzymogenes TaxID=69 RepID=UPI003D2F5796